MHPIWTVLTRRPLAMGASPTGPGRAASVVIHQEGAVEHHIDTTPIVCWDDITITVGSAGHDGTLSVSDLRIPADALPALIEALVGAQRKLVEPAPRPAQHRCWDCGALIGWAVLWCEPCRAAWRDICDHGDLT